MKNFQNQLTLRGALTVAFLAGLQLMANAEGALTPSTAGYGANRRITTTTNHQGTRGYFTVPIFFIPVEYSLSNGNENVNRPKYNPNLTNYLADRTTTNPDGTLTNTQDGRPDRLEGYMNRAASEGWTVESSANSNPNDDKPTFYMVSRAAGLEVDAGIQWEWVPLYGYPPGWAAYISYNSVYTNPQVPQPNSNQLGAYRAGPGTPNPTVAKYWMEYTVQSDGSARLHLISSAYAASADLNPDVDFTWQNATQIYTAAQRADLHVKRIVGMTQRTGVRAGDAAQLDGSWMRGCTFSEGEVQNSAGWHTWTLARTDNATANATGYAPGRFRANGQIVNNTAGQPINDKDIGDPRRYKVDFPGITTQASVANPTATEEQIRKNWHNQPGEGSRYSYEQVDINLRNASAVQGAPIRPRWFEQTLPPDVG